MADHAVDALFFQVQEALAGEYSLDRELGRGGMGVVYLAREVRLAREVALKVLPPHLAASADMREQFIREAQMAARLSHPNIVPIHRVGEAGDVVYFAMAYVPGLTLGEHLRTRGPLVPDHAIRVLREVAWALTYAHTSGLVHRDVKPDNIMLEHGTGRTLVTDFGIALTSAAFDELARDGRIVGTAHYMSPEQASGEPVDARSDIYSLGIVAYYAVTGRLPFEATSAHLLLAKHLRETPPPIRSIAPAVPQRLAGAIECCLAKDPAHRFQRASDFAQAIDQAVEPVREIPAPLRVWLSREEKTRVPRFIAALYAGGGVIGAATALTGSPVIGIPIAAVVSSSLLTLPTIFNTRRALKAGYSLADIRDALDRHWSRRREEIAVELGDSKGVTVRGALQWTIASGVIAGIFSRVAPSGEALGAAVGIGVSAMLAGGIIALVRKLRQRRAQQRSSLLVKLWHGKWGERIAKLASIRLRPVAAQQMLPQATEVALGRATDALYEALPKPLKKQLEHVPPTIRRLEADAVSLRDQIAQIESSIAALDSDARREGPRNVEAASLRTDLQRLRDGTNDRLATTVAALENIRLGLIRLQLGAAPVESVTAVLDAARRAAEDIDRAADAQREVERLLSATQSRRPVTIP
jgi:eukaryotic-like serine/threonine-protein kinase